MTKIIDLIADAVVTVARGNKQLQRANIPEREFSAHAIIFGSAAMAAESMIAHITGAPSVVCVSSGTAALHLALLACGVQHDDEVLMPSLTFAATANAAIYCGAHPHFVDVSSETFGINPHKLRGYLQKIAGDLGSGRTVNKRTGRVIRAIVPVHLLGLACDIPAIASVAESYGIKIVEDAAEALGTLIGKRHVGTFGHAGTLSFNMNKIVTMGGGGAVMCNDDMARHIRHLANQAKMPNVLGWEHDAIGYNYRPHPFGCAMALSQLSRFDDTLKAKRDLHRRYGETLNQFGHALTLIYGNQSNYWLNAITMRDAVDAAALVLALRDRGYESRMLFRPLHRQLPWESFWFAQALDTNLAVTDDLAARTVCLPSSI